MKRTLSIVLPIIVSAVLSSVGLNARPTLPSVFGDNMVLQQESEVLIWGWAEAGKEVRITPSWGKKSSRTTTDADGRWETRIQTPSAGGPHSIVISDGEKITLNNVLIGEVWICMGQSNMELAMRGATNQPINASTEYISKASPEVPIRMFTVAKEAARSPQDDCKGAWLESTPENAYRTSAVAQFFAAYLQDVLKLPVGIIVSSWGGTPIRAWMSREYIEQFPEVDLSILSTEGEIPKPKYKPTLLYNRMVHPIQGFTAKGFLWYQGESDRKRPELYGRLLPCFAGMLRDYWGNDDMPFYYVQIAPFEYEGAGLVGSALLREAQLNALDKIPNSSMVVTLDVGDEFCIHPAEKYTVGKRLALTALSKTYGIKGFNCDTPRYRSMEVKEGRAYLSFDCGEKGGLAPLGHRLSGFEIAGEDRQFHPAEATIEKGTGRLIVYNESVTEPVAVRYCFRNFEPASLYNMSGFPVSPFRTDEWEICE